MAYASSRGETPQLRSGDLVFGVKPRRPLLAVWLAEFHWPPTAALLREKISQSRNLPSPITISRIILIWSGRRGRQARSRAQGSIGVPPVFPIRVQDDDQKLAGRTSPRSHSPISSRHS